MKINDYRVEVDGVSIVARLHESPETVVLHMVSDNNLPTPPCDKADPLAPWFDDLMKHLGSIANGRPAIYTVTGPNGMLCGRVGHGKTFLKFHLPPEGPEIHE